MSGFVSKVRKPKAREVVMVALLSALTVVGNLMSVSVLPIQAGTGMVIVSGVAFGPGVGFLVGALGRFINNFFQGQGSWTIWQMMTWGLLGALSGVVFNKVDLDKPKSRDFKVVLGPVVFVLLAELLAYLSYVIFPMGETTFWGWRLYAFGVAGLLLGMMFQRKQLPIDDITLSMFTFLVVFIIYGGIMNIAALFTGAVISGDVSLEALKGLYITGAPFDLWHSVRATIFVFLFGEKLIRKLERVKIKYGFYRIRK